MATVDDSNDKQSGGPGSDVEVGFEPMKISTEAEQASASAVEGGGESGLKDSMMEWVYSGLNMKKNTRIPRRHRLVTEENARKYSLSSVRFGVLVSAINTKMLNPNYPLMVSGLHPDSFPDTEPFEFNSATYFLPMMSLLGVAISSVFLGQISDRIGRKSIFLVLSTVSIAGNIVKYYTRNSFWAFSITSLVFGLFLGNLPIAMAYVGDVFTSKKEKNDQLGVVVSYFVMGNAGGGIIAILMNGSGLFAPLWVGAGLSAISAIFTSWLMIEPGDVRLKPKGKDLLLEEEEELEGNRRPEKIDQCNLWNIVGGALADNFGSTALFPLCLSPLALEKYTISFYEAGEEPIMSFQGYQWLSVMVAPLVAPSTRITPYFFQKIGVSGTCVFGNVVTAFVTFTLLMIGHYGPANTAAFAGFVTVLYLGFPFTVFSQLTTGPMLDVIAPEDKIGFVQGLNNSAMNFGMAIAPWLFGVLADSAGTDVAIWTGIGVSLLAAAINSPLMWKKDLFGAPKELPPRHKRALPGEEKEIVERALQGEFVPYEDLFSINQARALKGKPLIVPKIKPYDEDKSSLGELSKHAAANFRFRQSVQDRVLAEISNPEREIEVDELCNLLNTEGNCGEEIVNEATNELGKWIGDYLKDAGFHPHINSLLLKQMILAAFPPVSHDTYTPENLEESLLRSRQIMNWYLDLQAKPEVERYTFGAGGQRFYS